MNKKGKIDLLDDLIQRAEKLTLLDSGELDALKRETRMILSNVLEDSEEYKRSLNNLHFHPMISPSSKELKIETWNSGTRNLRNLLETVKREIELFSNNLDEESEIPLEVSTDSKKKKVFIVHGHDNAMKLDVARTIETLQLEAVILSEQDDNGQTVIEKFENNANDCDYAVVLLSPDDMAYPRDHEDQIKYRARQNVILELGFFIGLINRKNVLILVKDDPSGALEIPSDYAGVVFTKYDHGEGWKGKLVKGLRASGFSVDANLIL